MTIRTRLLLLVFAVWLPAAVGFGLLAWSLYDKEALAAQEQVKQLADGINSIVERELDKRLVLAQTLASSRAVREGELSRFHDEASLATQGSGSWAVLLDTDRVLANTRLPFSPASTPRTLRLPLADERPVVTFVNQVRSTGEPVITVTAGTPGVRPARYNVGVSFSPNVIQAIVSGSEVPPGGVAAVIDANQQVMARSRDPEKWLGQKPSGPTLKRVVDKQSGFAEAVTLDGVRSLTYVSPPNAYGWNVVLGLPQSTLDATARRVTSQALTAVAALLVLGLALALHGARGVSETVGALRGAALELGRNQLPPRLTTGVPEVDDVGAALHEAGLKAQKSTRELEQRVQEAVAEVKDAHMKLVDGQKHEAIGRLTGGIAHDFNNLLQTISTALHVLNRNLAEGPQKRVLQGAVRATSKAADLVKQLLAFGRAQPLVPQPVHLNDMVLKMQELAAKAVGERIALSASIAPDLPAVFVDPVQLELALLNLVFNARDAMPEGGSITVIGRLATPTEAPANLLRPFVCVEVADTGTGMDEPTQAKAFEPYFTTKAIGAGSGLGLAQVQGFARQSGGDARLWSEPGKGTRITMVLPSADRPSIAATEPAIEVHHKVTQPLSILMVEDDVLVSSVVVPALEAEGHTVELCHRADDAVPLLQSPARYDVVFTDVIVPGAMNGLELHAWCKMHVPDIPVVVVTGYYEQSRDLPAEVIRKPYSIDTVVQQLRRAVDAMAHSR